MSMLSKVYNFIREGLGDPSSLVRLVPSKWIERHSAYLKQVRQNEDLEDMLRLQAMDHKADLESKGRELEGIIRKEFDKRLREINEETRGVVEEAKKQEIYAKGSLALARQTIKDLRNGAAIVPLLSLLTKDDKPLAHLIGVYLNSSHLAIYATPDFYATTQISPDRLSSVSFPTKGEEIPRYCKLDMKLGKREYSVHQRAFNFTDGDGNYLGTFLVYTPRSHNFFTGLARTTKRELRRNYAAIRELLNAVEGRLYTSLPEPAN